MVPMEIVKCANPDEAARKATESLNEALSELSVGVPTLLLLSGGSALNLLHGLEIKNLGPHITLTVLDERFSQDVMANNFAKISHTLFYHHALELGVNFIDTRPDPQESLEQLTARFEASLFGWAKKHPEGKIIATMGIGFDGHTSGIMPYPENPELFAKYFENKDHWAAGYDAGLDKTEYALRVTTNMPFLRNAVDFAVVYVTGEKKIAAFQHAVAETGSLSATPARIIREMKQVRVFSDI
jgi:6-phosphogluconolactonase/glucosamine-6-phosphate isomerase/deaminase